MDARILRDFAADCWQSAHPEQVLHLHGQGHVAGGALSTPMGDAEIDAGMRFSALIGRSFSGSA